MTPIPLSYALHSVPIGFTTTDPRIAGRLQRQWAPFPADPTPTTPPIRVHLTAVAATPPAPEAPPVSEGPVVVYHRQGSQVIAYFRRWGRYDIDLEAGTVNGHMTEACLSTYGVFEDMIIVALAPLLRRRGLFTLHAFAAALAGRAVLLVGDIGAGKTTTGINLLCHGSKLLSNDSPLLRAGPEGGVEVCAYPGLLSTYPDAIGWFAPLQNVLDRCERLDGSAKLSFAADDIWPDVWQMAAMPGVLLFPQVAPGLAVSTLKPLVPFTALQRFIGQSIENWDGVTIPTHLRLLRLLVDQAPAYDLLLAPDLERIPALILQVLAAEG